MNHDKLILLAMLNNQKIVDCVAKTKEGYPLIHPNRVPSGQYPLIEYHQISGADLNYADEQPYFIRSTYQLSFHGSYDEHETIREELDIVLNNIGFRISNRYSYKDTTTNIDCYVRHITTVMDPVHYDRLLDELQPLDNEHPLPDGIYFDEKTKNHVEIFDEDDGEYLGG